jgi:hyperosmotically inducible periplasmic protein
MATKAAVSQCAPKFRMLFTAAMLAAVLAGCAGTPTRESTGQFVDDSAITTKVKTALLDDKLTRGLAVHVETFKGSVDLSGFVNSSSDKKRAAEVASSVRGVKSVVNSLIIESNS